MPEQDYSAVIADAYAQLKNISEDTAELAEFARLDHAPEVEPVLPSTHPEAEASALAEVPAMTEYEQQSLGYMWQLSVTGIVIAAVLMLSLGVQLWQCFSDKWRA